MNNKLNSLRLLNSKLKIRIKELWAIFLLLFRLRVYIFRISLKNTQKSVSKIKAEYCHNKSKLFHPKQQIHNLITLYLIFPFKQNLKFRKNHQGLRKNKGKSAESVKIIVNLSKFRRRIKSYLNPNRSVWLFSTWIKSGPKWKREKMQENMKFIKLRYTKIFSSEYP